MAGDANWRQMLGQYPVSLRGPFALVEGSVADGAALVQPGGVGGESDMPEPLGGKIIGMCVGCEASANFPLTPSINGTDAAATYDVTVNAAKIYKRYPTPLAFDANDVLGINVDGTVSAAKDVWAWLVVVWDTVGG